MKIHNLPFYASSSIHSPSGHSILYAALEADFSAVEELFVHAKVSSYSPVSKVEGFLLSSNASYFRPIMLFFGRKINLLDKD